MKKEIIFITQVFPFPARSGGTIKTTQTLTILTQRYKIHLFCQLLYKEELERIPQYKKKFPNIDFHCFYNPRITLSHKKLFFSTLLGYFHGKPEYVTRFSNLEMKQAIEDLVYKNKNIWAIHIDHLNMVQFLPFPKNRVWIHEEHNIEHQLYYSEFLYSQNLLKKSIFLFEIIFCFLYEKQKLACFDHIFCISDQDEKILKATFNLKNTSTFFPIYLPLKKINLHKKGVGENLLFIGDLSWEPNSDGIKWFFEEIWPSLLKKEKKINFYIIGNLAKFEDSFYQKISHTFWEGEKENLTSYLEKADIFILPLRMGAGIRIKALTAFSAGIPIVSTKLGVRGLKRTTHEIADIAENADDFGTKISNLIRRPEKRSQLAQAGMKYLKDYYGEKNGETFLSQYSGLLRQRSNF